MIKKEKSRPSKSLEHLAPKVRINAGELDDEQKKFKNYYIYLEPNHELILTMLMEGYTQIQIAEFFGIGDTSWYHYRNNIPEFNELILLGRMRLMSAVEQSAYDLALGKATSRTVKTKEVYNPETEKFEPEGREVQVKQDKASEKMIQYVLGRLSDKWKGSENEEDKESKKVVKSIGALIDTLMETDDKSVEETNQESSKEQILPGGDGDSTGADSADEMD